MQLLHSMHIVHNDIKPENIAFSPYFNHLVLIDFGLSKIIKQNIGEKTLSWFVGSIEFCSK